MDSTALGIARLSLDGYNADIPAQILPAFEFFVGSEVNEAPLSRSSFDALQMTLLQLMDNGTPPIRTDRRVFEKMVPDFIRRLCQVQQYQPQAGRGAALTNAQKEKLASQVNAVLDERKAKKMFPKLALQLNTNWNDAIQARNSSLDPDSQEQRQEEVVRRQKIADVAAEEGTEPSRGGQDWRRISGLFLSTNNYKSAPLSRTDDPEQRVRHLLCNLTRPKAKIAYEELEKVAKRLYQSDQFRASCFQSTSTIPILFKYSTAECEDAYNALGIKRLQWMDSSNGHNYGAGHYIQTLVGRMLREQNARPRYEVSWIGQPKDLSKVTPVERLAIDRVQQHRCLLQEVANAELNIVKMKSQVYGKDIDVELTSLAGGIGDKQSGEFIERFRQIVLTPLRHILNTCSAGMGSAVDDAVVNRGSADETIGKVQAKAQDKGEEAAEEIATRLNSQVNEINESYTLETGSSEARALRRQAVDHIPVDLEMMEEAVRRMMQEIDSNRAEISRRAGNIKAIILYPQSVPHDEKQPRNYGRKALLYSYSRLSITHDIAQSLMAAEDVDRIFTVFCSLLALLSFHPIAFAIKDAMDEMLDDFYGVKPEVDSLLNVMRGFMTGAIMCTIALSKSYFASFKTKEWMAKILDSEPALLEWKEGESGTRSDSHGQCQNPRCQKTERAMELPSQDIDRVILGQEFESRLSVASRRARCRTKQHGFAKQLVCWRSHGHLQHQECKIDRGRIARGSGWALARSSHKNNLNSYKSSMGKKWSDQIKQKFVVWLATDESQKISLGRIKADNLLGHGSPGLLQDPKRSWSDFVSTNAVEQQLNGNRDWYTEEVRKYRLAHGIRTKTNWDLKTHEFTPCMQLNVHTYWTSTSTDWLFDVSVYFLDNKTIFLDPTLNQKDFESMLINAGGSISEEELLADVIVSNDASKWPSSAVPVVKTHWIRCCIETHRQLRAEFWDPFHELSGVIVVSDEESERELVAEQGGLAFSSEIACRPNFPTTLVTHIVGYAFVPSPAPNVKKIKTLQEL
ncbi:hypothetical protein B0H16DRAFT_1460097 [Mycena metata]|uniref:BRCT domain-containing protein n=1 Tax=Mycena metata TaxID=1033252 RepID=A0AAD7IWT9_9AGAR|nr:hypothetical protein B0H16DRAFT_1460097 [Mycena metata]